MKLILKFILSFIVCNVGFSQINFDNYSPLKAKGEMPDDYTTLSWEKYLNKKKDNISKNDTKLEKKAKKKFYLNTSFSLDEILMSGKVLFGDPLTKYVEDIAKDLLHDAPQLLDQLTFFTFKSSAVNAFATDRGQIFINTGLIAQVENEAQLAFVIAHEIGHIVENHHLSGYIEQEKILRSKKNYGYLNYDAKIDLLFDRSREDEVEADEYAVNLINLSKYGPQYTAGAFDVLLYSYLPFDEIPFDTTFFDTPTLKLPEKLFLSEAKEITAIDNENDDRSTHPNIFKRKEHHEKIVNELSWDKQNLPYAVKSQEEFEKIRDLARFEIVNLNLVYREYEEAIYHAYILEKKYPNNHYLKRSILKALYALSMYKLDGVSGEVLRAKSSSEGESYVLNRLFRKLKGKQLATLTLNHFQHYLKNHSEDDFMLKLRNNIIEGLVFEGDIEYNNYYKDSSSIKVKEGKLNDSTLALENNTQGLTSNSKYSRIKKKKALKRKRERRKGSWNKEFHVYLKEYFDTDPTLVSEFKYWEDSLVKIEAFEDLSYKERRKVKNKRHREIQKNGLNLGVENLVMVDPIYQKWTPSKGTNRHKSQKDKVQLFTTIDEISKATNVNIKTLDSKAFGKDEVSHYNQMATLKQWVQERVSHSSLEHIVPLESDGISDFTSQLNSKYACFTSVNSFKMSNGRPYLKFYLSVYGLILGPMYPIMMMEAFRKHHSEYINAVFDLENGKIKTFSYKLINRKHSKWLYANFLYQSISKLN